VCIDLISLTGLYSQHDNAAIRRIQNELFSDENKFSFYVANDAGMEDSGGKNSFSHFLSSSADESFCFF
jgi:hypothetical protein